MEGFCRKGLGIGEEFSATVKEPHLYLQRERFTGLLVKILYRMWGNVALPNPFSSS